MSPRLRRRLAATPVVAVEVEPIAGGLEAAAVHRVRVTGSDRRGGRVELHYVRKLARGFAAREAAVYRRIVVGNGLRFAPRVLDIDRLRRETVVLYLEAVQPHQRWPWRDVAASAAVLERVATLHALPDGRPLPRWDYERELADSAGATAALARSLVHRRDSNALVRDAVRPLEAFIEELPRVRRELLAAAPFGTSLIHGDLHPGNVLERKPGDPVLIDWARTRAGSAFEDVSSWLQSLAYWEPEARRRHDTLLVRYLAARGLRARLTSDLRDLYWLAAACNALAGALAFHLTVASAAGDRATAARSAGCARDWIRIIRRARASLHA